MLLHIHTTISIHCCYCWMTESEMVMPTLPNHQF